MKTALVAKQKQNSKSARELFRSKFQRSLRECLRHGFVIEECFGLIWEETMDDVCLLENEQSEIYEELIAWARNLSLTVYAPFFTPVIHKKNGRNRAEP
jgi:hypothetical protein